MSRTTVVGRISVHCRSQYSRTLSRPSNRPPPQPLGQSTSVAIAAVLLTGVVGTGKTTLCRELLENLDDGRYRTALLFNPFLNGTEMLQALLAEFGCSYPPGASKKELLDRLNRFLLSQLIEGKTCVAIFDEAQAIKNPAARQTRAARALKARCVVSSTGVEKNTVPGPLASGAQMMPYQGITKLLMRA